MSAVVHSISDNPRLRIRRIVAALVARQRAAALEQLRTSLPLLDPDRHALDTVADTAFAALACQHPEACTCAPVTESSREARLAQLLDTIRTHPGRWTAGRVHRIRLAAGGPVQRGTARRDLIALAERGHLTQHGPDNGRFYTLNTREDHHS